MNNNRAHGYIILVLLIIFSCIFLNNFAAKLEKFTGPIIVDTAASVVKNTEHIVVNPSNLNFLFPYVNKNNSSPPPPEHFEMNPFTPVDPLQRLTPSSILPSLSTQIDSYPKLSTSLSSITTSSASSTNSAPATLSSMYNQAVDFFTPTP